MCYETNRPARAIGWDCQACARNFCQEPSEVNISCELGIADAWVKCLVHSVRKSTGCNCCRRWITRIAVSVKSSVWISKCVVRWTTTTYAFGGLGPKLPLHRHNWVSFSKFQDRTFSYPLSSPCFVMTATNGETCKYAMGPNTETNLERFSTYWYAPLCCVCLDCCAAEFGSSREIYELLCILVVLCR
jgi:hypothetical protein